MKIHRVSYVLGSPHVYRGKKYVHFSKVITTATLLRNAYSSLLIRTKFEYGRWNGTGPIHRARSAPYPPGNYSNEEAHCVGNVSLAQALKLVEANHCSFATGEFVVKGNFSPSSSPTA